MIDTGKVRNLAGAIDDSEIDAEMASQIADVLRLMSAEIDEFRSFVRGREDFASDNEFEGWKRRQRRELIQCRRPFESGESASDRIDAALADIKDAD